MLLGQVIGTVGSTRKDPEIEGVKLLVVQQVDMDGHPSGATVVAADAVGAGVGEVVLYAAGSSARQTQTTKNRPIDHVIMAIVDEIAVGTESRYVKDDVGTEG